MGLGLCVRCVCMHGGGGGGLKLYYQVQTAAFLQ